MCTRALPLVKCTRLLADSILLSRLTLSLSIPPPSLPPVSDISFHFLYYTHLASIKQTHHKSPTLPYPPPPFPHPAHPTTPSRLHTVWCYPSSTIRLNLVNHSHGRSKHHLVLGENSVLAHPEMLLSDLEDTTSPQTPSTLSCG